MAVGQSEGLLVLPVPHFSEAFDKAEGQIFKRLKFIHKPDLNPALDNSKSRSRGYGSRTIRRTSRSSSASL